MLAAGGVAPALELPCGVRCIQLHLCQHTQRQSGQHRPGAVMSAAEEPATGHMQSAEASGYARVTQVGSTCAVPMWIRPRWSWPSMLSSMPSTLAAATRARTARSGSRPRVRWFRRSVAEEHHGPVLLDAGRGGDALDVAIQPLGGAGQGAPGIWSGSPCCLPERAATALRGLVQGDAGVLTLVPAYGAVEFRVRGLRSVLRPCPA